MPRQRSFAASRGGVTLIAIGLIVLVVAVAALSIEALRQGRGSSDPDATVGPAPTFSYAPRSPAPPSSPTSTPSAAPAPGASERFLSVGSEATWRGTAGVCGGIAPLIERSSDGGSTWQSVTPTSKGIAQLQSLTSFGGRNATAVADMGSDCARTTLRTYTDGQFWEPYPDIFAVDTYTLPGERAVVVDGKKIAAPCATPWGLRSGSGVTAVICDGTAYRLDGQNWTTLTPDARAVAVASGHVYVARADAACTGIRISDYATAATDIDCITTADTAGPLALDATSAQSGTSLTLWAGSKLIDIPG
ncbi:hypothetical protein ITJ43_04775 [Microbacterium sp. VKM Ac-2870]|uniref:hypothetical protein n=1 Tax=Microbacterium sp. VKM Ac-2870 TaxID=2783825 RepID=UPI00188BB7FF|nr:hypothetical protein [Microbacterium sp. VKM Ac-2870]MBF4561444.1 hypothetical protein [Microbacterium sp. VKM Ac-2870]